MKERRVMPKNYKKYRPPDYQVVAVPFQASPSIAPKLNPENYQPTLYTQGDDT